MHIKAPVVRVTYGHVGFCGNHNTAQKIIPAKPIKA